MTWTVLAPIVASIHGVRLMTQGWRAYRAETEDFTDLRHRLAQATLVVGLGFGAVVSPVTAAILLTGFLPIEVLELWRQVRRKRLPPNAQG